MPPFEIINQTNSGKAKVRYRGIDTVGYRDLEANEPVAQQSYAAAVGNEKSSFERDDEGKITERTVVEEDERPVEEEAEAVTDEIPQVFRSQRFWLEDNSNYVDAASWEVRIWKYGETPDTVGEQTMDRLEEKAVNAIRNGGIAAVAQVVESSSPDGEEQAAPVDRDEATHLGDPQGYVSLEQPYGTYHYQIRFLSESLERVETPPRP